MSSDPEVSPHSTKTSSPPVHLSIPLPWFVGLIVVLMGLTFMIGRIMPFSFSALAGHEKERSTTTILPSGDEVHDSPMGRLQYTRLQLSPPIEFIHAISLNPEPRQWWFHTTQKEAKSFLDSVGLSPAQSEALWSTHRAEKDDQLFFPDDAFVCGLSPTVRRTLYTYLSEDERNLDQVYIFRYLGPSVKSWLEPAQMSPEIVQEIESLSYRNGPFWIFSDLPVIWAKLPDKEDRIRLLKTMTASQTWQIKLAVNSQSNVKELAEYWGRGGRVQEILPFLESQAQARDGRGGHTTIRSILPSFVQTHLFTYPLPTQNRVEQQRDCHWTAMNYWQPTPSDAFADNLSTVTSELRDHFYPIEAHYQLGDVLLFSVRDGESSKIFHSAVYIADDFIFTKNGRRAIDPWMFMRLDEMKSYYPKNKPIEILAFRHKDLPEG